MNESNTAPQSQSPFRMQVEEPELWQRVVKVEVARSYFDHQYAQRLLRATRQFERPGFRKGKAPRAMVEKELGSQLRSETLEWVIPEAFKAAIIEHELVPITDPMVENLVMDADNPISFQMTIEVRPKIEPQGYDDLPLRKPKVEVSDSEVADVLERLRESRAIYEKVDRPARSGDQVVMDLVPLLENGQPDQEHQAEGQKLLLGSSNNIDAFEEAITGAEAGQEREVKVQYPDDHVSERLRGKTTTYRCLIKEVQQKTVPELDDVFAAGLSEGGTLLELRQTIRQDLQKEEENRARRQLEEQIVDLLIQRNEISVPPSLVEQYLKSGLEELHGRNAQSGRPNSPEQDEHYRTTTKPIAERIMKGMFIMEAVRRQENIQVSEEEIDQQLEVIAKENGFDLEKYREYVARSNERERIQHSLEERKTFDFLLSRAVITEEPAAAGNSD